MPRYVNLKTLPFFPFDCIYFTFFEANIPEVAVVSVLYLLLGRQPGVHGELLGGEAVGARHGHLGIPEWKCRVERGEVRCVGT